MKTKNQKEIWKWVLGIIGIIIIFSFWNPFDNNDNKNLKKNVNGDSYDWESYYGDDWEGYLQEELEEEGFEVISLFVSNLTSFTPVVAYFNEGDKLTCKDSTDYCIFNKKTIRVEMKSLGNRAEQIKKVITNSVLIGNLYGFWIEIHSPTDTCTYVVKWDDWVSCLNDQTYSCNLDKFLLEDSLFLCE